MDCVPKCTVCSGLCHKVRAATAVRRPRPSPSATWAPNKLPIVVLPCGCHDIPWPIFHKLGDNFKTIVCDIHGEQKITKKVKESWKKLGASLDDDGYGQLF